MTATMRHQHPLRHRAGASLLVLAALTLAACGGAGTSGGPAPVPPISAPSPTPTPTPTPTPFPTPAPTPAPTPPATNFDTAEYRFSDGPAYHGALTAWSAGATGAGVTIAVIDSGLDAASSEFEGRIHPQSGDVTGNGRSFINDGVDNHGFNVAQIALGGRNDSGTLGIAFDSTLLVLRADRVGSCTTTTGPVAEQGCRFSDTAIAAGIDRAVAAGARVINISLGGSAPSLALRQAVERAGAAGVIIVVSAGNDGDGSDPDINPNQPNPFAQGLQQSGGGLVIIAGSTNDHGNFSNFANRAGDSAAAYLTALGERVCCDYAGGIVRRGTGPDAGFVYVISGTSFAAPQIAGAAALLAQAFPNLTGQQIVGILLNSATDAGAPGIDSTYGRGILSIARAFAPQGQTSIAGTSIAVPLDAYLATTSGPMGDGAQRGPAPAVVLDAYARAYRADLSAFVARAPDQPVLAGALDAGVRSLRLGNEHMALSVAYADPTPLRIGDARGEAASRPRTLGGSLLLDGGAGRRFGFAAGQGGDGLVMALAGVPGDPLLVAGHAATMRRIDLAPGTAAAVRQSLGQRLGLTVAAESGRIADNRLRPRVATEGVDGADRHYDRLTLSLDGRRGAFDWQVAAGLFDEADSLLGARFAPGVIGGARSLFADASARIDLGHGWRLGGSWREGRTQARAGGLATGTGTVSSRAWAFDIGRAGMVVPGDVVMLRVAQPLRVRGGGLTLLLPTSYDYATATAGLAPVTLALEPSGAERVAEGAWVMPLGGGTLSLNAYWRNQPSHIAAARDDLGAAVRLAFGF